MKESSKPLKILLAKTRFCSKRVIVQLHCCILLFTAHALERYHIFFTVINHFHIFQIQPANKMEQILINLRLQSSSTERCTRKFCFFFTVINELHVRSTYLPWTLVHVHHKRCINNEFNSQPHSKLPGQAAVLFKQSSAD